MREGAYRVRQSGMVQVRSAKCLPSGGVSRSSFMSEALDKQRGRLEVLNNSGFDETIISGVFSGSYLWNI